MTERRCGTCTHHYAPSSRCKATVPDSIYGYTYRHMTAVDGKHCGAWQERPRMSLGEAFHRARGYIIEWNQHSEDHKKMYERMANEHMTCHKEMLRIYREHNGEEYDPNT